jgi:hypothetical protein
MRSPLRQADETTTGKATLPKSDYGRCEHPCDVVTDSGGIPDYGNRFWKFGIRDAAFTACCPMKRKIFPAWKKVTDQYRNRRV